MSQQETKQRRLSTRHKSCHLQFASLVLEHDQLPTHVRCMHSAIASSDESATHTVRRFMSSSCDGMEEEGPADEEDPPRPSPPSSPFSFSSAKRCVTSACQRVHRHGSRHNGRQHSIAAAVKDS